MGKSISASTIKSWFQYRCERKTRYEITDPSELAAVPVVKDEREAEWARLGQDYEKRVIRRLAREARVLLPGPGDDALSEQLASAFMRGERAEDYAVQVNLRPRRAPPLLPSGIDIRLRRTFADLIRIKREGDRARFRAIDIKATRNATQFHKVQVAYYARMLEASLGDLGVPSQIDDEGEVWHIPPDGTSEGDAWAAEAFKLGPYLRLVDEFCRRDLPRIAEVSVRADRDDTFFHLYFKCEQCEYLPHCYRVLEAPPERRDISAIPGMSHEAKRTLKLAGIHRVGQLATMPNLGLAQGWALRRRADSLIARARAQVDARISRVDKAISYLMPARADVVFVLTVDYDPVDDTLATLGLLRHDSSGEHSVVEVVRRSDPTSEANALVRVFQALIAELIAIDAANAALLDGDPGGVYAHIFLYEPTEAINLQRAVGRHLDDPRIRTGLLNLVRIFPPEEVVPEPEFRGIHHLPATALRSVLEQLYAVPALVAYDLRQVSQAVRDAGASIRNYCPSPDFERPFSSLLSIDVIRRLRDPQRRSIRVEEIDQDVQARLAATLDLVSWILQENVAAESATGASFLRLTKRPFRFHATFDPLAASDLDILQAFELLENRAGLLATLVDLAQSAEQRRDSRRCIAHLTLLRAWDKGRRHFMLFSVPRESLDSDIGTEEFGVILTDDNPDVRLDPQMWSLFECRVHERGPQHSASSLLISIANSQATDPIFNAMRNRAGEGPFFIDRIFRDFNTARSAGFLRYLAGLS